MSLKLLTLLSSFTCITTLYQCRCFTSCTRGARIPPRSASYTFAPLSSSAVPGLYIETLILLPFFLVFSIWFYANFDIAFFNVDIPTDILLFLAGAVTVVPLALFNAGAKLLPMTTVGILFLITPTLQFLVGYYLQNESVNTNQLLGFVGVWTGLIMYSYGLIKEK